MTDKDVESVVEEANDRLAEGLESAQMTAKADTIRPSTLMAFDAMKDAHELLCRIDPTREDPEDE